MYTYTYIYTHIHIHISVSLAARLLDLCNILVYLCHVVATCLYIFATLLLQFWFHLCFGSCPVRQLLSWLKIWRCQVVLCRILLITSPTKPCDCWETTRRVVVQTCTPPLITPFRIDFDVWVFMIFIKIGILGWIRTGDGIHNASVFLRLRHFWCLTLKLFFL